MILQFELIIIYIEGSDNIASALQRGGPPVGCILQAGHGIIPLE